MDFLSTDFFVHSGDKGEIRKDPGREAAMKTQMGYCGGISPTAQIFRATARRN
jgi:hypothetical protein